MTRLDLLGDRAAKRFALGFALVLLVLGLGFPSREVHGEAFDELAGYELPGLVLGDKHRAADAALWSLTHASRALGHGGRSIGPARAWNTVFTTLALLGVFVYAFRLTRSTQVAGRAAALLGGSYVGLHWLRDPFLPYWPTSLAFFTWMLVAAGPACERPPPIQRRWLRVATAATLGALACAFNPMLELPVAAACVTIALAEKERGARPFGLAVVLVVAACAPALGAMALLVPHQPGAIGNGIYGQFRAHSLELALGGLRGALLLPSPDETLAWLGSMALLALLAALVAAVRAVRGKDRARWRSALPLLAATLPIALFVTWWDAGQPHFWLLVPWLGTLGWLTLAGGADVRPWAMRLGDGAIALLVGANALGYVVPSTLNADPAQTFAERARGKLGPDDLIVFPAWAEASAAYYAGIASTGWLELQSRRRPDDSTFDVLVRTYLSVAEREGRVWVTVGADDRPDLPRDLEQVGGAVRARDLDRLNLGLTMLVPPWRLRRVVSISRDPPCAAADRARPAAAGVSVHSGRFVEQELSRVHAPERALDGDPWSEWLSDDVDGFIELYFQAPRPVSELHLSSSSNRPWNDFATRVAELSVWLGDRRIAERRVVFPSGRPEQRVTLDVPRVSCVRLFLVEHVGRGGGFAEIGVR